MKKWIDKLSSLQLAYLQALSAYLKDTTIVYKNGELILKRGIKHERN